MLFILYVSIEIFHVMFKKNAWNKIHKYMFIINDSIKVLYQGADVYSGTKNKALSYKYVSYADIILTVI